MADQGKPFVCRRRGWLFNIRPRTVYGWWLMALWMAPLMAASALHGWLLDRSHDHALSIAITMCFATFAIGWLIGMVRWMLARSIIIGKD